MKSKQDVYLRSLKRNGAVTFTTDCLQLQQLLNQCEQLGIRIDVRRFPSFISVVLKQ